MRFETYVALRYLRAKRKSRLLSLITVIAIAGVAVGVTALVVVLSIVTGFEEAFRAAIIGNRAHITVESTGSRITIPRQFMQRIQDASPEVVAAAPIMQVEALLKNARQRKSASAAYVVGIDPEREQAVTNLGENLVKDASRPFAQGRMPCEGEIVLGYRLAEKLGVAIGDKLNLMALRQMSANWASAASVPFTVAGISQARMLELDSYYAYVTLEGASKLCGRPGADAIQCKIKDPVAAEDVARRLEDQLGVSALTWYESQEEFFAMLQQNKGVLFIILVFIILVASFNIASTLIMMVVEKRQDIGILRTIGVSGFSILAIFIMEGVLIGASGTAIGVVLGSLLAFNINPIAQGIAWMMGLGTFSAEIYQLDALPAAIDPLDVSIIALSAILLSFISTIYPAVSAARLAPIDALRRE